MVIPPVFQLKKVSNSNGIITATNEITGTTQVTYQANAIKLKANFQTNSGPVFFNSNRWLQLT